MANVVDKVIRPILSEKTLASAKIGRYTFEVQLDASKDAIKEALKTALGVKVKTVKTAIMKDSTRIIAKSRHQVPGRKWKKAVVELSEGKIDMFEITGGTDDQKS